VSFSQSTWVAEGPALLSKLVVKSFHHPCHTEDWLSLLNHQQQTEIIKMTVEIENENI
jgi:hypothetical protein